MASKGPVVILEGSWWSNHEVPLILPYFNALVTSHQRISLSHRTIRGVDDIAYYVAKIPKNAGAMLYFACHGEELSLFPTDDKSGIKPEEWLDALRQAKEGALSFVHFGCCEMVDLKDRRGWHEKVMDASGARWVSGYTQSVDWLQSTFLDLALVANVFAPDHAAKDGREAPLKRSGDRFISDYDQLARSLGFSALSNVSSGQVLFPARLR